MQSPSVSVIIPAHNASKTLRACLTSVRSAEYDGQVEVVVVDDASTDDTASIAASCGCRVIRRETNGGPARSRNAGAKAARGEVLIFIDADTEMRTDTIRQGVQALGCESVGAVSGMYEPEPVNEGFFPKYYAYLKFHTFMASDSDRIMAFGAQCAAISKRLFEQVGGYRALAWGTDIENEELGLRIHQHAAIALSRDFRVRHNFPGVGKLTYVFTNRVYWWVLFRHFSKRDETVLMTRGFGIATAALPAAALCVLAVVVLPLGAWSAVFGLAAVVLGAVFVRGYGGFWRFCFRRRGAAFTVAAALVSVLFAIVISASAFAGFVSIAWSAIRRRDPPFAQAALWQA